MRRLPLLLALAIPAAAAAAPAPFQDWPADELARLATPLRTGDLACIESHPDGKMRQVTVIALVAAAPETVRQVVLTPEKWPEFGRNLARADVRRRPDGWIDYDFALDLKVATLDNNHSMRALPDGTVEVRDREPSSRTHYKWMFVPAPGGTVLVHTGYSDVFGGGSFVRRFAQAVPTLEHGVALTTQLFYVRSVKGRAEALATKGSFPPPDPAAKGPGFRALLDRGRVVVVRYAPDGRLGEFSILDTARAPRDRLAAVLMAPAKWREFIDGIKRSVEIERSGEQITFETDLDLPLITWTTRFGLRVDGGAVDVMGLSGELRGSRYRWDLTARGPKETLVTLRARTDLVAASPILLGSLFRREPLFEHGAAIALALPLVIGVRGRAEGAR